MQRLSGIIFANMLHPFDLSESLPSLVVSVVRIVIDGMFQPRDIGDFGSADRRTSFASGTVIASPEVLRRVNAARTNGGAIEGADVCDADFTSTQIVEMDIHRGWSVDRDVYVLVRDHVLGDYRAHNRS